MEETNRMNIIVHLGNTKVGTYIGGGVGVLVHYLFPEQGVLASSFILEIIIAWVWPVLRTVLFAGLGGYAGYYGSLLAKNTHLYILEIKTKKNRKNEKPI